MKLDEAIDKRKSVRKFSTKKVKWDDILEAIDASSQAPFAGNINHLKFIIISNEKIKGEIADNAQQDWIADAPYIVVVCSDPTKLERLYDVRAERYSYQQSGAAIQNFLLKITELGLATCWVGAYADELIKQILKIPGHINVEAVLPIGYESRPHSKKPKKSKLDTLLNWETWNVNKKPMNWPNQDPTTKESVAKA